MAILSMVKHTLFFSFKPDVPEPARQALLQEHLGFPAVFPWMRNFALGRNISERDRTYEYAFTIDFDSEDDLRRYLSSAEHEAHVVERFRPLISVRAIVSFVPGQL